MKTLLHWLFRWLDRRAGETTRAAVAGEPNYPGLPTGLAEEHDARPGRFEPADEDWAEYAEWSRCDDEAFAAKIREHDSECDSAEGDAWYRWMIERSFYPGSDPGWRDLP